MAKGMGMAFRNAWSSRVITTRKRGVCGLDGQGLGMAFRSAWSSKVITTRKRGVCGLDGHGHENDMGGAG